VIKLIDQADLNDAKELFEQEFPNTTFLWRDKGHYIMTNCPFHNDHKPSLGIYTGKDGIFRYNCFACHTRGKGVVGLLKESRDISYKEAYKAAIEEGLLEPNEAYEKELTVTAVLNKFYSWTNALVRENYKMMQYLTNRGVDPKIIEELPIGLYPGNAAVFAWAEQENVPFEIVRSHLITDLKNLKTINQNTLIFFYRDFDTCEFSFLKIRNVLAEESAKRKGKNVEKIIRYLGMESDTNDTRFKRENFGYFGCMADSEYVKDELDEVIMVEGEFDALTMISRSYQYTKYDLCTDNIIAVGSCVNFNKATEALADYKIYSYVFPDNDSAGLDAVKELSLRNPYIRVVMPDDIQDGEDPADYMLHHDYENLLDAMKEAKPGHQFLAEYYGKRYSLTESQQEKQKYLFMASDYGINTLRPIDFEAYADAFCEVTGFDRALLRQDMESSLIAKQKEDCEYFISTKPHEYGTHKWVYNKNGKVDTLISKVILSNLHSVYEDNCEEDYADINIKIGFHAELKDRVTKKADILLESADYLDNKKFNAAIVDALGPQGATPAKYVDDLREALKMLSSGECADETVRRCTGWSRDKKEYYFFNAMVDKDGVRSFKDVKVLGNLMPQFMRKYRINLNVDTDRNFEEATRTLFDDILKVYPYTITLPAFTFVMSSVVHEFVNFVNPTACVILGHTNSYKTSWTKTLVSLFGNFTEGNFISWSSTALSIPECGWYPKDAIFTVDDCKPNYVNDKAWVSIIQNAGDSAGRTKLSKDSTVRSAKAIRGAFLNTGEDIPSISSESAASRTFVLKIEEQGDKCHLDAAQAFCDKQILPAVLVRFIRYLINHPIDRTEAKKTIRRYRDEFKSRMARTNEVCAYLKFVWELLCNILPLQDLQAEFDNALKAIEVRMSKLTKNSTEGVLFKDTLRELLAEGNVLLAEEGKPYPDTTDIIDIKSNTSIVGWIKGEYAYVLPSLALKAVQDRLRSTLNTTLQVSPNKLYDELKKDNYIVPGTDENLVHARPIWDSSKNPRVLRFRKDVLVFDLPKGMAHVPDDVTEFEGYEY